jgi:hypothetical protein
MEPAGGKVGWEGICFLLDIPSLNLGKFMVFCVSSCGAIVCVVAYGSNVCGGELWVL